jgi:hypothetical protein
MGAPYDIDDTIQLGAPYDIDATICRYIVTLTPSAFSTCASDLCVLCTHLLLDQPVHFTAPVHFTHAPITSSTCVFSALVHHTCGFYARTYY